MKACKHFAMGFGDETNIIQSEGYPWNGWLVVWHGDKQVYSSFQAGLFWDYLEHLLSSKECRKEIGWTKRQVADMLQLIERKWEKVTG